VFLVRNIKIFTQAQSKTATNLSVISDQSQMSNRIVINLSSALCKLSDSQIVRQSLKSFLILESESQTFT